MYDFNKQELEILDFWKKKKIFEKLREKNKGKVKFRFLDGPITANNPMGVHHAWGRTYKDLFHRFKAMQGHEMRYQNGFDCQGLWVEREEEKTLGLKNKEDIEKFGIKNFVESCKKRVEKFSEIQKNQSIRLGYWMDWDNSYYTNTDSNNLHNWFLLKKYHEKNLIYKGTGVVPWCPRCGTASSKHDIATEGYKEVKHSAIFMQFPLKENPEEHFLIFTTTPWTVPCNVAIAVNKDLDYVLVENQGLKFWIVEKRLEEIEGKYKVIKKIKGKELKDKEYTMPFSHLEFQKKSPHKVVLWEMASEEEGTGIVHVAPGCGAEDHELGEKLKLPSIAPLNEAGYYKKDFGEFSLKYYSQAGKEALEEMDQRKFLYKIIPYKHRYPHCWRCGEELVFRLVDEWYVKCTEEFRDKLKSESKKIKWYPEYGGIRQETWFENMGDWMISRKRYYGHPLPIWECGCGNFEVIGSLEELKEKSVEEDKLKIDKLISLHRPYIDEIKIKCPKCKKSVKRIQDVGDAWLDAGIVGFSTIGPYLENKEYWKEWYPADLISENLPGQYRGWFNALFWASVMLTGQVCFKKLFGYETLKDEKGKEMHKSKGNAIWFDDAVEKVGADSIRLLYCLQDPSQELKFGYNVVKESKNSLNILYNLNKLVKNQDRGAIKKIEDRWILSKLNSLIEDVTEKLENLHPHLAARKLKDFWLNDFSRGYVQIVRERLSSEDGDSKYVLKNIYLNLIRLCSPFIPFISEVIWQNLRDKNIVKEESVHLSSWPKLESKKINKKLETDVDTIFKIIEMGLSERDVNNIGLKWPLRSATIHTPELIEDLGLLEIIKQQLNIKSLKFEKGNGLHLDLDLEITPELEAEGFMREMSRNVQAFRKKLGLEKKNKIELFIQCEEDLKQKLEQNIKELGKRTNSLKIEFVDDKKEFKNSQEFKIKTYKGVLYVELLN